MQQTESTKLAHTNRTPHWRTDRYTLVQDTVVSDIKNLSLLKKDCFTKNNVLEDVQALFKNDQDYYQPTKTKGEFNSNYLKSESNGNENKNLSLHAYIGEILQLCFEK